MKFLVWYLLTAIVSVIWCVIMEVYRAIVFEKETGISGDVFFDECLKRVPKGGVFINILACIAIQIYVPIVLMAMFRKVEQAYLNGEISAENEDE